MAFERFSGFFHGCEFAVPHETSVTYYDATGKIVAREYRIEDKDGKEQNGSKCEFMYRQPYKVYPDWISAAKALGLPQL